MGKGNKKNKPANGGKKPKKSGPANVNAPRMKQESAPAAIGHDFQTFFKETRRQMKGKDGKLKDAICVEGREYLGPVTVGSTEEPGSVYQEVYIAPGEFGGTRLSLYAQLYEKFLFELLDFEYVPSAGSETPGSLVIAHDRDISDPTPPVSQAGVRQFLGFEDAVAGNVWMKHVAKCPLRSNEDGFFTNPVIGGDDRFAYQGQTYVACVVPSGKTAGTVLGSLLLHYRCCFFVPQLENELAAATMTNVDAATLNTSASPGTLYDVLAQVRQSLGTKTGLASYTPQLQADGTYAIKLVEGVYNYLTNLTGGVTSSTGSGVGTVKLNYPQLEVLEPNAVPAPQAEANLITYSGTDDGTTGTTSQIAADAAATENIVPPMQNWLLNVPRGGALLRHSLRGVLSSGTTKTWTSLTAQALLTRLGGYLSDVSSLVPSPTPAQVALARSAGVDARCSMWRFRWRVVDALKGKVTPELALLAASLGIKAVPSVMLQKCFFCGLDDPGHLGRDCPKKVCVVCGKVAPGHNRDDCPEVRTGPPAGSSDFVSSTKLVVRV